MAQAFKCDVCKNYFDGHSWDITFTIVDTNGLVGNYTVIKSCCVACKERKLASFTFEESEM